MGVQGLVGDRVRATKPFSGSCTGVHSRGRVWRKGDQLVGLVDLLAFGRPVQLP